MSIRRAWCIVLSCLLLAAPSVVAQDSGGGGLDEEQAKELAKKTQNPVSDLISLPFQNNLNFDFGEDDDLQWVLNVQPVVPQKLSESWNLIHRIIIPLIDQPDLAPGLEGETGLGDVQYQGFFSPRQPGKVIWGVGPVINLPTATEDVLGTEKWSAGPGFVFLTMPGNWVIGSVISQVWSFAGTDRRDDVSFLLWQPFVNYNLKKGWYLTSSPIVTSNWEADSSDRWTIPIGGGGGRITRWGKRPVNVQSQIFYMAEHPDSGPEWQLRFQIALLYPKKPKPVN